MGLQSNSLIEQPGTQGGDRLLRGTIKRVRVISLSRKHKTSIYRYLAPVDRLTFDPGRYEWHPGEGLFAYTASKSRKWRIPRAFLSLPIAEKWAGQVPLTFVPNWIEVWRPDRPRKEAGFLWSMLHKAVAVNQWRNQSHPPTSAHCTCCNLEVTESIQHCFFDCTAAVSAWDFAISVLHHAARTPTRNNRWDRLEWHHCLIGTPLPPNL